MDASRFADKINFILENEDVKQKMGNNSYSLFESYFNIEKRIGELENIYKQI